MSDDTITTRQAHDRLRRVEQLVSALMRGPNLDAGMVAAIRKSGPSAELLARMNLSNAVIRAPNLFRDPLAKDLHITGKVGGLAKRRRAAIGEWGFGAGHHQRTNLMYPVSRPSRPRGLDGGRSFHMREEIMHTVKQGARSVKQARQNYTLDASKVPIVEAMLDGSHLERGLYLFRDSVSVDHNGYRLAVTSLGKNNDTVIDGWQHIESTEIRRIGEPIERHLTIDLSKSVDLDFWQEIKKQPGAPDSLIDFLNSGDDIVRFTGKESKSVECCLRKNGWHDQKKSRKRADITFNRGRQVITQRRLVFELPDGLPLAATERITRGLAKEFVDRNLPFVLVVHKPDESNDERNWHIHLDYHHRPMTRFYPETYRLPPLPADAGKKQIRQHNLAKEALAKADLSWTGKWDSEIQFEYKTPSGRKKTTFPFIQDTHSVFRKNGEWLKTLRSKYADIINEELVREDLPDRFDPRSFEDRNIDKIPDAHLNTSRTRCERTGRPTLEGAMNEQCQWNYEVSEVRKRYPGGDRPDGDPLAVAGYVSAYLELLRMRLRSRSDYVLKFAKQEEDWDSRLNPTPSSVRRNKRGDYRPERLVPEAGEMLYRIDDVWPHIAQGLSNLAGRIRSVVPQLPAREATTSSAVKPPAAAKHPRQAGNADADKVSARAPLVASTKLTPSLPLKQEAIAHSKPQLSFDVALRKMRESSVAFTISQTYERDKKVLIASVADRDASAIGLPRKIVARHPQERADLMSLLDERANIDAPSPKAERGAVEPDGSEKARLSEASPSAVSPRVTDIAKASPRGADQDRALEGQLQKHSLPNTTKQPSDAATSTRPPIEKVAKQPAAPFVFDAKFPDRKSSVKASVPRPSLAHDRAKIGSVKPRSTPSANPRTRQTQTPIAQASALKPKPSQSIVSQNPTALTAADRNQMETKPFYLIMQPAGTFLVCSTKAPASLVSAASDSRYVSEFEGWLRRQQSEQQELAKLFTRSRYSDASETDRAVASGKADPRLTELWKRWENTLLLDNAVSLGMTIRRETEREAAKAEERKRELQRQAALVRQFGPGL